MQQGSGNVMLLSCMIMGERVGGRDKNKGLPLSCHITKANSLQGRRKYNYLGREDLFQAKLVQAGGV